MRSRTGDLKTSQKPTKCMQTLCLRSALGGCDVDLRAGDLVFPCLCFSQQKTEKTRGDRSMVYSAVHNVLQNATPNELRGKRSSSETNQLQRQAYGCGALSLRAITLDVTCTCLTGGRLHNDAFEEGLGVRQVRVALKVPPEVPLVPRTSSSVAWCWRAHSCTCSIGMV